MKTNGNQALAVDWSNQDVGKNAQYEVAYIPSFSTTITINTRSPQYQVKQRFKTPEMPVAEILKRVPPLNRLSDVMWTVWNTVSTSPNDVRYIGHNDIINEDTHGIMDEIFSRGKAKKPVEWPGLTFGLDSREGQALLATPNGVGTAWFLIDHAGKLGRRIPTVTIFSPTGLHFRMLWDLRPLTPTSLITPTPTMSKPMSTSRSSSI
ncbi:MAG: hypothetical protein Q9211_004303 [Gyalolechia sp. 1 TL-2023]